MVLSGRTKDSIALPNGFKVYPEDLENALRNAGIRDSIVLETQPGRIEAIVLAAGVGAVPGAVTGKAHEPSALRAAVDAAIKSANAVLGPQQRIVGWRLWPDDDFPRTHTLKVKREPVRRWVAAGSPSTVAPSPPEPAGV